MDLPLLSSSLPVVVASAGAVAWGYGCRALGSGRVGGGVAARGDRSAGFECVVGVVGDVQNEIAYLGGELGGEGGNNVVVIGILRGNAVRGELGLNLSKPNVWVGGPKWG